MGKIFGISDLPVSTIMTPFEPVVEFKNPNEIDYKTALKSQSKKFENQKDAFISKESKPKSNPFVKMRNGIGKLMKHISGKI